MKNLFKKVLCTAIVATQVMTGFTSVKAAEDLLLLDANFDALSDGVKTGLTSSDFNHYAYDYSSSDTKNNTEITAVGGVSDQVHIATSTAVGTAGYGRDGKAFNYNVDKATANESYTYDFKWAPWVKSTDDAGRKDLKVTYEMSLRAPVNTGDGYQQFDMYVPIDGSAKSLISMQAKTNGMKAIYVYDKTDGGTWRNICNWEPGKWYNLAVTLTPGTNKLDYYVNGKLACNAIYGNEFNYVGGRFRLIHNITAVNSGSEYTDSVGVDDIRIFIGTVDATDYNTALTSASYRVSGKEIYMAGDTADKATFISKLTLPAGATAEVYKDAKCTTVADTVTEGCTVVVTSKNKRALDYYTTKDKEVIIDADMESSNGIAENTIFKYTNKLVNAAGDGAGNIRFEVPANMTTSVKEAGAGKDGYAYFFETKNETDKTVSPGLQFAFVPTIRGGKVTTEISILAPDSYNTITSALHVAYNGSWRPLLQLYHDGKIGINNKYIEQWVPGRWYNLAVVLTPGSATADFYLNGKLVLQNEEVYTFVSDAYDKVDYVGGRMKFLVDTLAGKSGVTAIDDIKVYTGDYDATGKSADLVSISDEYEISEYGYIFAPEESVRVNVLNNKLDGDFTVYEDDSFEETPVYTDLGNIIAVNSELGNVVEYYELIPDGNIAPFVNQGATTKLTDRESFGIAAMARYEGAMVYIAIYSNEGELLGVRAVTADESRSEYTSIGLDHSAGNYAALMLWDGETFAPVCEPIIIK